MPKTRKTNRRNKRKGGAFPWVELPPEVQLMNTIGEPEVWESRAKVSKPYTSAVVIDNRVYVLMMNFDSEKANNSTEPYPVYFYLGDVGDVWQKDVMVISGVETPIVIYYLLNGLRIQFAYRELDKSKGNLLGRKNPISMFGQGLEFYYSTDGIDAGIFMSRFSADAMKNPEKSVNTSKGPTNVIMNVSLIKAIVGDIEKRMEMR